MKDTPLQTVDTFRISLVDRCDMRCVYCMPEEGVSLRPRADIIRFEEIVEVVKVVQEEFGLRRVRLTGGEPLLRKGLPELVRMLDRLGLDDIAMTTNALRLAGYARELKDAGLRRVNISLDSLDPDRFRKMGRRGNVEEVLKGIDAALEVGLTPVHLNTVVLRGENDGDILDLARFALDRGCEIRYLELMPISIARDIFDDKFFSTREVQEILTGWFRMQPLPHTPGATSRRWMAADSEGRAGIIGFISPTTNSFCEGCKRLRISATGQLIGCLAHDDGPELRPLLRGEKGIDRAGLARAVHEAWRTKTWVKRFTGDRLMVAIGG